MICTIILMLTACSSDFAPPLEDCIQCRPPGGSSGSGTVNPPNDASVDAALEAGFAEGGRDANTDGNIFTGPDGNNGGPDGNGDGNIFTGPDANIFP